MPARLALEYSEGVATLEVHVTNVAGQRFESGPPEINPDDHRYASVPLRPGELNIYFVGWKALADDGHDTDGSFFFIVGDQVPGREELLAIFQSTTRDTGLGINLVEAICRAVLFIGLMLLTGLSAALMTFGRGALADERAVRMARRVLQGAAVALVVGSIGLAGKQLVTGYGLSANGIRDYLASNQGAASLVRLAVGGGALLVITAVPRGWVVLLVALGAGVVGQLSVSLVSHSSTLVGGVLPILADYGHLVFGALWAGGLVLLAVVLPLAFKNPARGERDLVAQTGRRFSLLAIAGVGGAVLAGLLLASWHAGGVPEVVGTLYGQSILVKIIALAFALSAGAANRLFLVEAMRKDVPGASGRFRRSVTMELLAVGVLFVASAVMTSSQTGTAARQLGQHPVRLAKTVLGTNVVVTITPGDTGLNVVDVQFGAPDGSSREARDAALLLSLPVESLTLDEIRLEEVSPGLYSAVAALTRPGDWQMRVTADVRGTYIAAHFDLPGVGSTATGYANDSDLVAPLRWLALLTALATVVGLVLEMVMRRAQSGGKRVRTSLLSSPR
jgi:putative copper export protein